MPVIACFSAKLFFWDQTTIIRFFVLLSKDEDVSPISCERRPYFWVRAVHVASSMSARSCLCTLGFDLFTEIQITLSVFSALS